jgi:hypothetical protein
MMDGWGRFLGYIAVSCFATLALSFLAVVAIDPYGYLGFRKSHQVTVLPERLITPVRASDQSFNSAIVGSSVAIPLLPSYLSELTGQKFVALGISGSGPKAQLAVLSFFLRRHSAARDILVGFDDAWCTTAPNFKEWNPFPFWLYGSDFGYLFGLARNVSSSLLLSPFDIREKGPLDNHEIYPAVGMPIYNDVAWVTKNLTRDRPTQPYNMTGWFPALDALSELIEHSPATISFVLVWTPRYINIIPQPGSRAATSDKECKAFLLRRTAVLRNVRVLDWSEEDRADNHDPMNFYDHIHYREPLARHVEEETARSFAALAGENR